MKRLAAQAIRTLLLHRQPRRRQDQKSLQRTQHGPHTTRKGTNGHVTMYIMYITVISHWVHPNVRIRVSIKLHLQCPLSNSSSHCTALPIPSQHHSPRTTQGRSVWNVAMGRDGRYVQVLANLEQPSVQVARLLTTIGLWFFNLYPDSHPLQLYFRPSSFRQEPRG